METPMSGDTFEDSASESTRGGKGSASAEPGGLAALMDSLPYGIFIGFLTLMSLIMDDVRVLALDKDADFGVGVFMIFIFVVFMVEIILNFAIGRGAYPRAAIWNCRLAPL